LVKIDEKIQMSIERNLSSVFDLADWLNSNPEIGGEEKESSARITSFLEKQGYEITNDYGGMRYAFLAVDKDSKNTARPKAALLCEYDALPEVGHACGHSMITAMSVLAALSVIESHPDFPLKLDLVGTPDEEGYGGKVLMAKNGAFDSYEFALMGHPDNVNVPQIKVLACDGMYVTFKGVSAHASSNPWGGVNALSAAQIFMHASDAIRQHLPPGCQIHGIVVKGGTAPNTVPDHVELNYYYRATRMDHLKILKERLENCVRGAAIATGCTYQIDHGQLEPYADLSYLPTAIQTITDVLDALGQPWQEMQGPEGSTDAGNIDLIIPTFHLEIAATDCFCGFHTKEFEQAMHGDQGRRTLRDGTSVLAQYAYALGTTPGLLDTIKAEHQAYRGI
jgi:amidohydrolase